MGKGLGVLLEDSPADYTALQGLHFQSGMVGSKEQGAHLLEA